jgi:hypothetical protein
LCIYFYIKILLIQNNTLTKKKSEEILMIMKNKKNNTVQVMVWFTPLAGDIGCGPWFRRYFLKTKGVLKR